MPPLSGDEGRRTVGNYKTWMKLMMFQYENLERWSKGDFLSDWNENVRIDEFEEKSLEELPIQEQPSALDRSGLELCIGAPLFPGIEVTHHFYRTDIYSGRAFKLILTLSLVVLLNRWRFHGNLIFISVVNFGGQPLAQTM